MEKEQIKMDFGGYSNVKIVSPDLTPFVQKSTLKVIIRALQQELDSYDAVYALKRENLNLQYNIKDKTEKITNLEKINKEILADKEKEKKALKEEIELLEYKLDKLVYALADANKRVKWYKKRKKELACDYPSKDRFLSLGSTRPTRIRNYLKSITKKP